MRYPFSPSLHHGLAVFAVSALALSARADMLWSEIQATPAPAALSRALVHVDPSASKDSTPANLGTAGGTFTAPNGDGPQSLPHEFGTERSLYFNGWKGSALQLTGFQNNSQSFHVFMVTKGVAKSTSWGGYMSLVGDARFRLSDAGGNGIYATVVDQSQTFKSCDTSNFKAVLEYKVAAASGTQVSGTGAFHTVDATSRGSAMTASCSAFNHTKLLLGDRDDGSTANFHMGEFLLFTGDTVPTTAEAEEIALYLRRRWLGTPEPVSGVVRVPADETGHISNIPALCCDATTVFDVAEGATLFIDCPIVDGAAPSTFVKRGAGTLVLTRACPISGQIVVEAGKLELRGEGSLPNAKVNGTLTLGAGAAATFSAQAAPLPAALKKAVVWVDPSATTARIPANLGTAKNLTFTAPNSTYTGPAYATGKFSGASGSLPGLSFWGSTGDYGEAGRVLKLTGLQNTSRSLRVFMVHQDNATRTVYAGYLGMRNSAYGFNTDGGKDFWICINGTNNEARLIGNSKTLASGNAANSAAIMEYNIKPTSQSQISGVGALHYKTSTVRGTSSTANLSTAYNHDALWLGDRGGDGKCGRFNMGEFLLFFGDGLNGEALSDSEANEVVAYLRKKWLGATTLVENDSNPAPTALAVEAGDTATLNGSAAPGLVKTGAGTLKVSGAVSALTVSAGAVEFADNATSVDALTLANGAGLVYNGVAGTLGTVTVPADATVTVAVGATVDRHLEEQTILSFAGGTISGAFTIDEEAAKRWSIKVIGNDVKLLKNSGLLIIVR